MLRILGANVSSSLLNDKLRSHPDYPSFCSITDTLDELGIDNAALQIDKEKLMEAPVPFLAQDNIRGELIIINNPDQQIKGNPGFEKNWNGTALLAEKPHIWKNSENEEALKKEKKARQKILFSVLFLIAIAAFSLFNYFSAQLTGILIATFTGLSIAVLIVQHELGISNELTEQLCSSGKNTDCDAVMQSKGSQFNKWMNWADAGIIYFASYSLLLIASLYGGNTQGIFLLSLLSLAAIPFTLFSLYYQWRVIKKWCTLCLIIVGVLWLQFALLLPVALSLVKGESAFASVTFSSIGFSIFIFSFVAVNWLLLIKPAMKKNKELTDKNFSLLRFKYNPQVFDAFLKEQRKVDITFFENDLQLGNPYSPLQIVVACNPYCGPCAVTHKSLHELAEENNIGLTIRLSVKAENKEDKRTIAARYILQVLTKKKKGQILDGNVLHDWYVTMDFEKFRDKYPLHSNTNVQQQLEQHEQWIKEAKIEFTPTIFINGYQLPKQYKSDELKYLLKRKESIAEPADEIVEENHLALA